MASIFSEANLKFVSILVTAIIGIGGLLLNIYEMQRNTALEARRPFLEKQMDLCFQASSATASLATSSNAEEREKSRDLFWALYWGQLGIVEDDKVEAAMVGYKNALKSSGAEVDSAGLSRAALGVAHACRDLILESWDIDLPILEGRP